MKQRRYAVQMMILGRWEIACEHTTEKAAQDNAARLREWCSKPIQVVDTQARKPGPNLSRILDVLNKPLKALGQ